LIDDVGSGLDRTRFAGQPVDPPGPERGGQRDRGDERDAEDDPTDGALSRSGNTRSWI
jgi:hypothetical protein